MITVLTGGTGGAKFVDGLRQIVASEELTIIVNTGDDMLWWGLYVSPDVDSRRRPRSGNPHFPLETAGRGGDTQRSDGQNRGPAWYQGADFADEQFARGNAGLDCRWRAEFRRIFCSAPLPGSRGIGPVRWRLGCATGARSDGGDPLRGSRAAGA